jgi:nucleoid DNA-binding protein
MDVTTSCRNPCRKHFLRRKQQTTTENPLESRIYRHSSAIIGRVASNADNRHALLHVLNIRILTMATKAKAPAKKVTKPAAKAPAKKATAAKPAVKPAAKPAVKPAAKKVVAAKKVAAAPKAIKAALNKTQLIAYLVEQSGVEAKAVKAVLASLETSVLGSVDKKGAGEFTLPGLFKVSVQKVPAKAKRFGKDPFTGEERWFPAKPASVKVKVRPLKKLKDAAQ